MSRWTHNACGTCYDRLYPGRRPVKLIQADAEITSEGVTVAAEACCFCGQDTFSGIYVRYDPEKLRCRGVHV